MAERPTESSPQSGRPESDRETSAWHRMAGVGVEFIAAVLVFGGLGWWLDGVTGMRPWLLIAGCALGFAVGLGILYRVGSKSFR